MTNSRPTGLHGPDTARLCAAARAQAKPPTGRPAIVAHVATGRADAAEHGHAPDPTEPPGQGVGALIQRGGRAVAGMLTIATAGGS